MVLDMLPKLGAVDPRNQLGGLLITECEVALGTAVPGYVVHVRTEIKLPSVVSISWVEVAATLACTARSW